MRELRKNSETFWKIYRLSVLSYNWPKISLGLALLISLLLSLPLLDTLPFHHDEALYATWALPIATGENIWLKQIPIDKPPLFLYLVGGSMALLGITETAARFPSLLATLATVGLTFQLGQDLYDRKTGLIAAWLVGLSPYTILFAPTALTDPLLMALIMGSSLAALRNQNGWAGFWLGLALATKQQALFFSPLILGLLFFRRDRPFLKMISPFLTAFGLISLITLLWDMTRQQTPGFWQLSAMNYGGLTFTLADLNHRWNGFIELLGYGTASPILNTLFLIGLPLLLLHNLRKNSFQADGILSLFSLIFFLAHILLSFQVWDRYLLGLMPLLALLMARILCLVFSPFPRFSGGLIIILLIIAIAQPIQDAANARYPLGSHSQAFIGIDQIVAYLRGQVGANHTLHHRWLSVHWRFYLAEYPYDLRYWSSPRMLAAQAQADHFILFPTWRSETEARIALSKRGLALQEVTRAYHPAGYPSLILYQIVIQKK